MRTSVILCVLALLITCSCHRRMRYDRNFNRIDKALSACKNAKALRSARKAFRFAAGNDPSSYLTRLKKGLAEAKIAQAYFATGQYEYAAVHFTRAAERIPSTELALNYNLQLAETWYQKGDTDRARQLLYNLLIQKIDPHIRVLALNHLGAVYHLEESYDSSLYYYHAALTTAKNLADSNLFAPIYGNLAYLHALYNEFPQAHRYLDSLSKISKSAGELAETRGVLFLMEKNYVAAEVALLEAWGAYKKQKRCDKDYVLLYLGDLYFNHGDYRKSGLFYKQGYARYRQSAASDLRYALIRKGIQENARGRPEKALILLQNLADEFSTQPNRDVELAVALHTEMGKSYEALGQVEEAFNQYIKAADMIEASRKRIVAATTRQLFFRSRTDVYERLVELLYDKFRGANGLAQQYADQALSYAEKSKARVLAELLVERSQNKAQQFSSPVALTSASQILQRPGELLVEYNITDSALFTWVIRNRVIVGFTKTAISRSALFDLSKRYRTALLNVNPTTGTEQNRIDLAHSLFDLLVEPWITHIQPNDLMIFVPDEFLFSIPLESLLEKNTNNTDGQAPRYLLNWQDVAFCYYPSAALITHNRRRKRVPKDRKALLAFGISSDSGGACCPTTLPSKVAEGEAISVAGICNQFVDTAVIFQGRLASEAMFKGLPLEEYNYIHLSTHAFLEYSQCSSQPFLRFNDTLGSPEDGCLQLDEIYRLILDAQLVTLSACESGHGSLMLGEGLIGVSHAFFAAGAQSLIVCQWPVNETGTFELMRVFYDQICHGVDKATALRRAKEFLLGSQVQINAATLNLSAPYLWAGYILIGEAGLE